MAWPQAYAFEQGDRLRLLGNSTHGQGLQQVSFGGSARIESGGRILKDRLHFGPQPPKLGGGKLMQRASGNEHRTAVWCEQAERDPAKRRLSRTALADQGHRFAGSNVQIDRADSDNAVRTRASEGLRHILELQQRRGHERAPLQAVAAADWPAP